MSPKVYNSHFFWSCQGYVPTVLILFPGATGRGEDIHWCFPSPSSEGFFLACFIVPFLSSYPNTSRTTVSFFFLLSFHVNLALHSSQVFSQFSSDIGQILETQYCIPHATLIISAFRDAASASLQAFPILRLFTSLCSTEIKKLNAQNLFLNSALLHSWHQAVLLEGLVQPHSLFQELQARLYDIEDTPTPSFPHTTTTQPTPPLQHPGYLTPHPASTPN